MSATAAMIARLRRMVNESGTDTYTDEDLAVYIETYPLIDERGEAPFEWDTTDSPPSKDWNEDWLPTYDLNAAAADIWQEKAAAPAGDYDFSADGGSYSRSQAYEQAMKQARYYRARRSPGTFTLRPEPTKSSDTIWLGNAAEAD